MTKIAFVWSMKDLNREMAVHQEKHIQQLMIAINFILISLHCKINYLIIFTLKIFFFLRNNVKRSWRFLYFDFLWWNFLTVILNVENNEKCFLFIFIKCVSNRTHLKFPSRTIFTSRPTFSFFLFQFFFQISGKARKNFFFCDLMIDNTCHSTYVKMFLRNYFKPFWV